MTSSLIERIRQKQSSQYDLHDKYLNHQLLNVLKTLGFNKRYVRAEGQYLYDDKGALVSSRCF